MKLYLNYSVDIKFRTFKSSVPYIYGFKQGYSLAPTLFMLDIQLSSQELSIEF